MLKTKLRAFTLLEALVALLVIAGSLTVYQGLTKIVAHQTSYLSDNTRDNWLLFCQQFRQELAGASLDKVDSHRLYIRKKGQSLSFGKFQSDDFRKTNGEGKGYQPMLFGVRTADFSQSDQQVTLRVTFETGLERTFVYAFEKTP